MILKSIIINGFKSFGKKTIIDISKNVTGIVGPNGSGKSNIVEAIRFVIGEQSMKNMRSKSLSDLIHLGEDKLNRASVSLIIENDVERFAKMSDSISPELINFLKVDEIILTREIFIDGESNYKINNTVVRLKDIQYILSMVGIGASAHTIISQGEADNILSATPRDRKEIISEALGLRVLENRLKESKRKLDKTVLHISEVSISRKEIAPEIKELKLTVDKINNLSNIREKLYEEYINYLVVTNYNINLNQEIINNNAGLYEELKNNNDKLSVLKSEIQILDNSQSFIREEMESGRSSKRDMLIELEKEKSVLIYEKNIIIREMSDILEKIDNNDLDNNIIIDKSLVTEFCFNIKTKLIDISNDIKNKNYINIDNKINECFDLLKKTNK
ncbi:MAG: AAA family ATPase [Cyanobium sp. MAG06]|nr:AAA family ATPase [Cyanobium sp. MAG06]